MKVDAELDTLIGRGDLCLTLLRAFSSLLKEEARMSAKGRKLGMGWGLVRMVKARKSCGEDMDGRGWLYYRALRFQESLKTVCSVLLKQYAWAQG